MGYVGFFDFGQFFLVPFVGLEVPPAWNILLFAEVLDDFFHSCLGNAQFLGYLCANAVELGRYGQLLVSCLDLGNLLFRRLERCWRWNLLPLRLRRRHRLWCFLLLTGRLVATAFIRALFTGTRWPGTPGTAGARHWLAGALGVSVRNAHATTYAVGSRAAIIALTITAGATVIDFTIAPGSTRSTLVAVAVATRACTLLASSVSLWRAAIVSWCRRGWYLWSSWLILLAHLDIALRIKPVACAGGGGFGFGWGRNRTRGGFCTGDSFTV